MKTIILTEPGNFVLEDTEAPQPVQAGEALVRIRRIGVCGTDLHAFRGRQPFFTYPRILGHELGVEIVEIAPGDHGLAPGDQCAVEPYLNCGHCVACRRGRPNCCTSLQCLGVHCDGGMREAIKVPARKLHKSESLSLDQLALVETLGIGAHAVSRANLEPEENVLVVGAGPIGLSVVQFAMLAGVRIAVMDMNARRLAFCREQFGVEQTLVPGEDVASQLREAFDGEMPTAVFDATGSAASMEQSFGLVANSGRLILVGLVLGEIKFNDPEFHRREMTLLSSRNSTPDDFRRIISLIETGKVDTTPWITHRTSLESVVDTFAGFLEPEAGVIKAMIELA